MAAGSVEETPKKCGKRKRDATRRDAMRGRGGGEELRDEGKKEGRRISLVF